MHKGLFTLCLAAAVAGGGELSAQQPAREAELADLQESIAKARAALETELADTHSERSAAASQLQETETAIARVQQSLGSLQGEIDTLESELVALREQAEGLEALRSTQLSQLAAYLQAAHALGQGEQLKLLLNQVDPVQAGRMLQYYRYFAEARNARVQAYRETLSSLEEVSTNISVNAQELKERQESLLTEEADLARAQGNRLVLLDQLDIELAEGGASLAKLEQQQHEIELLLAELRSAITEINLGEAEIPFAERRGELPWPVATQASNRFGTQRGQGDLTWEGLLLPAAAGSPVRAVHHGRVIFADWLGSSGLLLIIDHGGGFMSLYAHNQELYRTVGEWVSGGDRIAAVGNTGGQRNSALYFEIRRNGIAENPVNWCVDQR